MKKEEDEGEAEGDLPQAPKAPPSLAINNFVGQYYQTSTFHHLSSWKARLQEFTSNVASGVVRPDVSELKGVVMRTTTTAEVNSKEDSPVASQASQTSSPEDAANQRPVGTLALPPTPEKLIVAHVDMDAFYVSVAIRDNPSLVGKPVVVCPSKNVNGTSEVSTCSYAARRYGIKPRMFVREARALCPDLICLPCEYDKYEKVSQQIYQIFLKYSNRVQAVSADEAFLDLSAYSDPEDIIAKLRRDIYDQTGCPASAGISHNLLLARLATGKAKPAGQFYLREDQVEEFMKGLNVEQLPGVGPSLTDKLRHRGIHTVAELRQYSQDWLEKELGKKKGQMLWNFARGVDDRSFQPLHTRKSIGTQLSWGVRFTEKEQVKGFLADVAKEVAKRMQEANVKGKRINLKIKRKKPGGAESEKVFNPGDVVEQSRSRTILFFTGDWEVIAKEALSLFVSMLIPPSEVRGVGLFVDKLDTEESEAGKAKGQAGAAALDRYFQARDKQSKPPHDAQPDLKTRPTEALEKEELEEEEEEEASKRGGGDTAKRKSVESADAVSGTEPASGPQPKRPKAAAPAKSPGRKANKALGGNVSPGKQVTLAQMFGRRSS